MGKDSVQSEAYSGAAWENFKQHYCDIPQLGMAVEYAAMEFPPSFLVRFEGMIRGALDEMRALEAGAIANKDEGRQVGHYWLRDPDRAPDAELRAAIKDNQARLIKFADDVLCGAICGVAGAKFRAVVVVGIGGSALGPQFVSRALSDSIKGLPLTVIDNTDPDGISQALTALGSLSQVLVVVISKSGGTKETRNGMLLAAEAFRRQGLDYHGNFVAITCEGSALDVHAKSENWLARFPLWDWVGGRTSELSSVGLLPAALEGIDVASLLDGARRMDEVTRNQDWRCNPALILALSWYRAGRGRGDRTLVVLPYQDRLELFSRYLQQLVMESVGKEFDRDGRLVEQGLSIFGNKGSTDQHAYVQQLRDGVDNYFAHFIQVGRVETQGAGAEQASSFVDFEVEPGITCGDYLHGFLQGTKAALAEKGRLFLTVSIDKVDAPAVGALIALFERAVGYYASFINVNAYHQPGVEAGKLAASEILALQLRILSYIQERASGVTLADVATDLNADFSRCYLLLKHLVATRRVTVVGDLMQADHRIVPGA